MILNTVSDGELGMILVVAIAIIGGTFAIIKKSGLINKLKKRKEQ